MQIHVIIGLCICAAALYFVWQFYQRKIERINELGSIPSEIPKQGFEVPVLATFTGIRHLPRKTNVAYNNAFPTLTLYAERLECRVLKNWSITYEEIESVDVWDTFMTRNLTFYVRDREETVTANLLNRRNLSGMLGFLKNRGVPLSSKAKRFIVEHPV
ncbi:MAG: hypothetical protein C0624_11820 [Desulfuromonas sp.]|nr:MAG: hypothetical protein C0624_11820 [Desulfuromonas sp.]